MSLSEKLTSEEETIWNDFSEKGKKLFSTLGKEQSIKFIKTAYEMNFRNMDEITTMFGAYSETKKKKKDLEGCSWISIYGFRMFLLDTLLNCKE